MFRNNLVNSSFGELYHASGAGNGYDGLNQLTNFSRGVLSQSQTGTMLDTIASPSHQQSYAMDAQGNFTNVTSDGTSQNRTQNQQNQITSITGLTTPGYDANGNTTTDQAGNTLVYDAWNRLVAYKSGSTVLVAYSYDALNHRITVTTGGTTTSLYYSDQDQVLEEQVGGVTQNQYVWSPVYVNALIERDSGSTRLYVQQDANWNVTALIDTSGNVVERYVYDPYGAVTILAPNWTTRSSSSYNWVYLFQGGKVDATTGLYQFQNRDYSPTLARWMEVDPIGFAGGDSNLYRADGASPTNATDPTGLALQIRTSMLASANGPSYLLPVAPIVNLGGSDFRSRDNLFRTPSSPWAGGSGQGTDVPTSAQGPYAFVNIVAANTGDDLPVSAIRQINRLLDGNNIEALKNLITDNDASFGENPDWLRYRQRVQQKIRKLQNAPKAPRTFKSFDQLKRELGAAGEGKVWHHIVEQRAANVERFGTEAIHNTQNVVPISADANQAIANYYASIRPFSKGLIIRKWLESQSFAKQREFGLDIMNRVLSERPLP